MRLAFVLILVAACAPHRPSVDAEQLAARRDEFYRQVSVDAAEAAEDLERLVLRHAREEGDDTLDILILSGGGAKGAFGAGFLQGWKDHPNFDVVTGVSTGALIAPFAFVGSDEALDWIVQLYRNPKKDWAVRRLWSALLRGTSFLDTAGLHRDLRAAIDERLVRAVAQRHRDGRMLMVGTTDLDLGVPRVWNLTRVAETGDVKRFQDVLLASSAIPGAFPPVEIDGQLYVDGGVAAQFVAGLDPDWLRAIFRDWTARHPGRPLPRFRIWVIVNNKLSVAPKTISPAWTGVALRSVDVVIRQAMKSLLYAFVVESRSLGAELGTTLEMRFVTIPDEYPEPQGKSLFDSEVMDGLVALGRRMGADPESWRTTIDNPDWPHPGRTPRRKPATSARAGASPPR